MLHRAILRVHPISSFPPPTARNYIFVHLKKNWFISFILFRETRRDSTSLLSAQWHRFAFLRQMNISAPSGNSMATARFPPSLWRAGDVVACTQSPCLVLYLLSLSPYHSRRLPALPHRCSHLLPFPRYDKTLPRLITFITRPGLLFSSSTPVYFCGEQSEERYSQSDDESMAADRRTHQRCHIASVRPTIYAFRLFIFFLLSCSKYYIILIYDTL